MEFVYFCPCENLETRDTVDGSYKCSKCGRIMYPLRKTLLEWNKLSGDEMLETLMDIQRRASAQSVDIDIDAEFEELDREADDYVEDDYVDVISSRLPKRTKRERVPKQSRSSSNTTKQPQFFDLDEEDEENVSPKISFIACKCPECKANLRIDSNQTMAFCQYCGCQIVIDDGVVRTEHVEKKIDMTRIKEIEAEKNIKIKEMENETARKLLDHKEGLYTVVGSIVLIILISLSMSFSSCSEKREKKKEAEQYSAVSAQMEAEGKISAGDIKDYYGLNYKAAAAQLEALGFTNIETFDQNNSIPYVRDKDTVDSISINGNSHFNVSDFFTPDAKVIISYY